MRSLHRRAGAPWRLLYDPRPVRDGDLDEAPPPYGPDRLVFGPGGVIQGGLPYSGLRWCLACGCAWDGPSQCWQCGPAGDER